MPNFLERLFASGLVVDIALAFILLECLVLSMCAYRAGRAKHIFTISIALAPGACLMIALRCALTGASPSWIVFWLTLSLPFHIWDVLYRRL